MNWITYLAISSPLNTTADRHQRTALVVCQTAAPMIAAGFTPAVPDRHRLASLIRTLSHRLSSFPDATAGVQARACVFPIRRAGGPPEQLHGSACRRSDHHASGSSHNKALRDVDQAGLFLSKVLGRPVHIGHLGGHGRPLADLVAELRATGHGRVLIASYLLAPGYFYDQVLASGAEHISEPLISASPERVLVDLVIDRYQSAARNLQSARWLPE